MIAIDRAMVLAAGLGTRMRPLTLERPKPLVRVGGKALLDHMLDRLAAAGVRRAVVNVHYLAEQIERHCAMRGPAPVITISDERDLLLETGGAIVKARADLGDGPIFVANTDQVWEDGVGGPALAALRAAWDPARMDALLLLAERTRQLGYDGAGDFFRDGDGRLARRGGAASAPYVFAGVYILNLALADSEALAPFSANRFFDAAAANGRLFGAVLDGFWMHVGDPQAREAAEARLNASSGEAFCG